MISFSDIAKEIEILVGIWEEKLLAIPEEIQTGPKNIQDRSVKQILGHMIDSVSNNTHRVVHLQYQESPFEFPNYATYGNNDKWIEIQNYQNANWENMVQLWKYSHLHFAFVTQNISADKLDNKWIADKDTPITLQEMIIDFPRHLKLHLSEIEDLISSF